MVEICVGRQVQLHRQEVYESLKEYLKGGLNIIIIIVYIVTFVEVYDLSYRSYQLYS